MQTWTVRPAGMADLGRLVEIAEAGDAHGVDVAHLRHVMRHGRLLVAADPLVDGPVGAVGFGGVIVVESVDRPVAMVTDLFVAPDDRGRGVGGDLLARLVAPHAHRMTCSSHHPAALAAYRAVRLEPRWPVRTLRGSGTSDDRPAPTRGPWRHDRGDLVARLTAAGAIAGADHVVTCTDRRAVVHRVQAEDPIDVVARLLAHLGPSTQVELSVPAPHPLSRWLDAHGFEEISTDLFLATPEVETDPTLAVVDVGLW